MSHKNDASSIEITPLKEAYFHGLWQALDTVAREKRYLAFLQAPPQPDAFSFYQNIVAHDLCQYTAIHNNRVVGWCDILPALGESRAHIGVMGIAVIPAFRHQGIGTKLIEATLAKAWQKGLSRIELSVRVDNQNAKALYERFGFVVEGVSRNGFCVDGKFHDAYTMALLGDTITRVQEKYDPMDTQDTALNTIYCKAKEASRKEDQDAIVTELLNVYLDSDPENAYAWYLYGDACRVIGRKEKGFHALTKAFELAPPQYKGAAAIRLGMLLQAQASPQEAKKWFQIATEIQGKTACWAWIFRAGNCQLLGEFEEAIAYLEAAIRLDTEEKDEAFYNLGLVYRTQGKYEKALNSFRKAVEITPDYEEAQSALEGLNDIFEALSVIENFKNSSK